MACWSDVLEKSNAPPVLQIAFDVDGTQPGNVTFTLGGRLTFLDVGGFGSEWRTDFAIGNTYGISSEYYRRFSRNVQVVYRTSGSMASNSGQWIYSYGDPQAEYRIHSAGGGIDVGYALDRFSEVRAGYEIGYLNADLLLGTPLFQTVSGGVGKTRFRYITDHLDQPVVPESGYFGKLNFDWVDKSPGATEAFPNLEMNGQILQASFQVKVLSFCWARAGQR